jgi:DNA polymerase elongation subunit (family B)
LKFYTNVNQIGNYVYVRGYKNGRQFSEKIRYQPTLYFKTNKETEFHTLDGIPVSPKKYDSIYDAKQDIKKYSGIDNAVVYGYEQFAYTYIYEQFQNQIEYDKSLIRIANIDIETVSDEGMPDVSEADKMITAITIKCQGKVIALGYREFTPKDDTVYIQCDNEEQLLLQFIDILDHFKPDCFTGWNIMGFDIPYLVNRIVRIFDVETAQRLSPWKMLTERRTFYRGVAQEYFYPVGIAILDYLLIYKKLTFEPRESYKLDYIAFVELGERKLDYSEYENLTGLYRKNHQLFMEYNIKDVNLVDRLEDKLRLIEFMFTMAYDGKCNYEDMLGSVKPWEIRSYAKLMKQNIVFPPKRKTTYFENTEDSSLEGGFVKDPLTGMHEWVVSFDLNSLYPHLIMQYNISPETFVGKREEPYSIEQILRSEKDEEFDRIVEKDLLVSANGCFYKRDVKGFFPMMMEELYNERVEYKKKMLDAKRKLEKATEKNEIEFLTREVAKFHNAQLNSKILLNACYGVLTNEYFRFYNFDNAEAITKGGQLSIRWVAQKLNIYMNKVLKTSGIDYVIYADTDSVYLNFGPLVNSIFDEDTDKETIIDFINTCVETKFQKVINTAYEELKIRMNVVEQKMFMKRESIADKAIFTGKKRYILNVWDKEDVRYKEAKINVTGLESVRSSTPSACREKLKETFKLIINSDENTVIDFIEQFRIEFQTLPFEDIAYPRSIKGMRKYADDDTIYKKGTPIQVRGALVYNNALEQFGIENKYTPIFDGDKIKYCYLLLPNKLKSDVVSIVNTIPKEFDIENKLDRDTQFEKCYLEPVKNVLSVIGWKHERSNTLDSLFG